MILIHCPNSYNIENQVDLMSSYLNTTPKTSGGSRPMAQLSSTVNPSPTTQSYQLNYNNAPTSNAQTSAWRSNGLESSYSPQPMMISQTQQPQPQPQIQYATTNFQPLSSQTYQGGRESPFITSSMGSYTNMQQQPPLQQQQLRPQQQQPVYSSMISQQQQQQQQPQYVPVVNNYGYGMTSSQTGAPPIILTTPPQVQRQPVPSTIPQVASALPNFRNLDLNNFEKVRLLGRGDVGKVYLVHVIGTPYDRNLFAMKVLDKDDMIKRNKVERIVTENEILSSTKNPFIVTLYSSFQDEDRVYLILEYCSGGEFFQALNRQPYRSLSEADARFYACEVLLALEYLHHIGVVYRDLKPENILLHDSGHIRLADFDLSKQASTSDLDEPLPRQLPSTSTSIPKQEPPQTTTIPYNESPSGQKRNMFRKWFHRENDVQPQKHHHHFQHYHPPQESRSPIQNRQTMTLQINPKPKKKLTKMNSFVGTAEYIAPEIIHGKGYFPSVDWWTLGILIYEMIYGRTPFRGKDQDETFDNIRRQRVQFPTPPNHHQISAECQDLIRRLLNPDVQQRLGSRYGAEEIKSHPWFSGVNWNLLQQNPPIKPRLTGPLDFHNFNPMNDESDSDTDDENVERIYSVDDHLDELDQKLMSPMKPKHRRVHSNQEDVRLFRNFSYKPSTPNH